MTEEQIREIVRDELEKIGGMDIGEAIALQTRQTCVNTLKAIGAEEFLRTWSSATGRGEA